MHEDALGEMRRTFRREDAYLRPLSRRTRRVLQRLIDHPQFAGTTDHVTLELLGAFASSARPRRALQLGTYIGFSALVLGDVLARNDPAGTLVTVEPHERTHAIARRAAADAGLRNIVFVDGRSTQPEIVDELVRQGPFELVYVDSSHSYAETLAELDIVFDEARPLVASGGLVTLHDASAAAAAFDPTGRGGVRAALEEWMPSRPELRWCVLERPFVPSVCGLALITHAPPS